MKVITTRRRRPPVARGRKRPKPRALSGQRRPAAAPRSAKGRGKRRKRQQAAATRWRLVAAVVAVGLVVWTVVSSGSWDSWSRDGFWRTDRALADPAALFADNAFHVYTTSAAHCTPDGCPTSWVPRFASASLGGAGTLQGDAMPDRPAWVDPDDRGIWAPSVARISGTYVMYFAASSGRAPHAGSKCLGTATSATPAGPFRPQRDPLQCSGPSGYWNIDPYVVSDGHGWFLLWREDDAAHAAGKVVIAQLRGDGLGFRGAPKRTLVAGRYPWEDGIVHTDPASSRDSAAANEPPSDADRQSPIAARQGSAAIGPIENPAMARHPDTGVWLLTWSANRWETPAYATGLATCRSPLGPCERVSHETPWLRNSSDEAVSTGAEFTGAGGLSFVDGPDGRLYAVFHAYRGSGDVLESDRVGWAYRVVHRGDYALVEF